MPMTVTTTPNIEGSTITAPTNTDSSSNHNMRGAAAELNTVNCGGTRYGN